MLSFLVNQYKKYYTQRAFQKVIRKPVPWTVPAATEFMESVLKPSSTVVEYGGGGSTLWFISRVKKLYTFEANTDWSALLINSMKGRPNLVSKWRFQFINCDWNIDEFGKRWYVKNGHESTTEDIMLEMETDFTKLIDDKIDLVFNDGSIRAKTLVAAVEMLKLNPDEAYLVVDNTEKPWRSRYIEKIVPKDWDRIDFVNSGPQQVNWVEENSRATIWIKRKQHVKEQN
jgi:hypothetical protein